MKYITTFVDAGIYEKVKSLKQNWGKWQLLPKAGLSFLCSICYKGSREWYYDKHTYSRTN
ncbi:MAG: hypothetical protein HDT41_02595 [Lachnospiraceae bacterium]|nr:hypothetical protein [Lachnospiraceae bacterium]